MSQQQAEPAASAAEIAKLTAEAEFFAQRARLTDLEAWSVEQKKTEYLGSADVARKYSFVGDVQVSSTTRAIITLEQWHREDPTKAITVEFNTPGGSLSDGFALYDRIRALVDAGTEVRTHATGSCLSMGAFLLQAGSERTMSENAWLMVHTPRTQSAGSSWEIEDEAKLLQRMTKRLEDILVDRTTLTRPKLKRNWTRKDWWFDAADAKDAGLIDRIAND